MRVPGTRAGLKERSQSAYAAPAPNPVESATGHVRPAQNRHSLHSEKGVIRERTAEENDGGDDADTEPDSTVKI